MRDVEGSGDLLDDPDGPHRLERAGLDQLLRSVPAMYRMAR